MKAYGEIIRIEPPEVKPLLPENGEGGQETADQGKKNKRTSAEDAEIRAKLESDAWYSRRDTFICLEG
ncbi:hypothetical protein M0P48_01210 [Candidatus Gracilibacteria bacterium]|nr:hypothetical protein [Candidatus Gracilibacteria bacterium]